MCSIGARKLGLLEPDTVTRMVIGANGLMIAWNGNRLPKSFVPNACARRARRVAGWSMALSGLFYASPFVFAPIRALDEHQSGHCALRAFAAPVGAPCGIPSLVAVVA